MKKEFIIIAKCPEQYKLKVSLEPPAPSKINRGMNIQLHFKWQEDDPYCARGVMWNIDSATTKRSWSFGHLIKLCYLDGPPVFSGTGVYHMWVHRSVKNEDEVITNIRIVVDHWLSWHLKRAEALKLIADIESKIF